jgi:hypothetical protein
MISQMIGRMISRMISRCPEAVKKNEKVAVMVKEQFKKQILHWCKTVYT